jgi:hypothetical protein
MSQPTIAQRAGNGYQVQPSGARITETVTTEFRVSPTRTVDLPFDRHMSGTQGTHLIGGSAQKRSLRDKLGNQPTQNCALRAR